MTAVRFNHMELTFPRGGLDAATLGDIYDFYGDVFGWSNIEDEVAGEPAHILGAGDQFILLAEADAALQSPGLDHLGLEVADRDQVDQLLEACQRRQEKDDRVQILEFDDIVKADFGIRQHFFYVRYLLPIYFDVHCVEMQTPA
jgi:hypothetical protein